MSHPMENAESSTIEVGHSPSMQPDARGARDAWLRSFSMHNRIGRTFGGDGAEITEPKSAVDWLHFFKVIDTTKTQYNISPGQLRTLYIRLAEKYSTAAAFHANLTLTHEALADKIERTESRIIREESAKYAPNGAFWDEKLNKSIQKRPAQGILESIAKDKTAELRAALSMLKREAFLLPLYDEFRNSKKMS